MWRKNRGLWTVYFGGGATSARGKVEKHLLSWMGDSQEITVYGTRIKRLHNEQSNSLSFIAFSVQFLFCKYPFRIWMSSPEAILLVQEIRSQTFRGHYDIPLRGQWSITLGARDFSSAVSRFFSRLRRSWLRPTPKIPAAREKNLWYPG